MVVVVPSPAPISRRRTTATNSIKKTRSSPIGVGVGINIPTINLCVDHHERSALPHKIVQACEEYGFFKVVNHGVPKEVISAVESHGFFAKTASEKQQAAGPANSPYGYGCKNIGFNGDMGELEYILLPSTNSPQDSSISDLSEPITSPDFSCAVKDYIAAVRELASEILNLSGEGLRVPNRSVFSRLIRDVQSDSCFRLNHYPPLKQQQQQQSSSRSSWEWDPSSPNPELTTNTTSRTGFGEHSDPQILTILRSNDVEGLQICTRGGLWIPVPPDPSEFCVFVGDALQVGYYRICFLLTYV